MSAESDARTRARVMNHIETKMRALTGSPADALQAAEDRLDFQIEALKESAAKNGNPIQVAKDLKEIPLLEAQLEASRSGESPLIDTSKVKNFHTLARDLGEPNDFGTRLAKILETVDETCAALPVNDRLFTKQNILALFSPRPQQTICKGPDEDDIKGIFGKPYSPGSLSEAFAEAGASVPEGVKTLKQAIEALATDVNETFGRRDDMLAQQRQAERQAQREAARLGSPGGAA